ncbi:MAG TPA: FHA domain-containing protein [bacterium]|nr:FHA domain-containing protein [bacterium]HOL47655.1 FHA domain-containing protein [bacterium]HPQ18413.1 FHA domain-containing protein [bacterium]
MLKIEYVDSPYIYKDQQTLLTYKITNYSNEIFSDSLFELGISALNIKIKKEIELISPQSSINLQIPIKLNILANKILISIRLLTIYNEYKYEHIISSIEKSQGINAIIKGDNNKVEITSASERSLLISKDAIIQRSIIDKQNEQIEENVNENIKQIEEEKNFDIQKIESKKKKYIYFQIDDIKYYVFSKASLSFGRGKGVDIQFKNISKEKLLKISRKHFNILFLNNEFYIEPIIEENKIPYIKNNNNLINKAVIISTGELNINNVVILKIIKKSNYLLINFLKHNILILKNQIENLEELEINKKVKLNNQNERNLFNILKEINFKEQKEVKEIEVIIKESEIAL